MNDLRSLKKYPYAGHAAILKKHKYSWQNTEYVLRRYAKKVSTARRRYREFVKNGVSQEKWPDLVGGGLIRVPWWLVGCEGFAKSRCLYER